MQPFVLNSFRAELSDPNLEFRMGGSDPDTIVRGNDSWVADGFAVGQQIIITGSTNNNRIFTIAGIPDETMLQVAESVNPETMHGGFTGRAVLSSMLIGSAICQTPKCHYMSE